jgi:phenylalanine-4-hydroxylase
MTLPMAELRGDYRDMRSDFTVDQDAAAYGPEDHETWRLLRRRQTALVETFGCAAFVDGVELLGLDNRIPEFDTVSDRIEPLTGWRLVAVPGLVPDDVFFAHLAARRFPVTVWMRWRHEIDYLVEPDLFHDLFGHAPLLTDPTFADFLQAYGEAGDHVSADGLKHLARLYWYTVEFGLPRTPAGLRAFGAGLLSSSAELVHAVNEPDALRVAFDAARVMRTDYRIDRFQETYFVLDDFAALFRTVGVGHFAEPSDGRTIAPGVAVGGDVLVRLYDHAA